MKIRPLLIIGVFLFGTSPLLLLGQSIAEKKASLQSSEGDLDEETERFLLQINTEAVEIRAHIDTLYQEALELYQAHASPDEYKKLLAEINEKKRYLTELEVTWRELASRGNHSEGYGLWHAPNTTLEQLVIDYGSLDYVYLIPPDVGNIQLSINSNLPIPRGEWSQMLELILAQNGVAVKTLNPYLRQLYLVKEDYSHLKLITNQRRDLEVLPPESRASFILSPEPSEVRKSYSFLEKFINPQTMILQILGRDILLIGPVGEIQDLLKLYDFIAINRGEKDYRLLPTFKLPAEEMAKILQTIFDQSDASFSLPNKGGGSSSSSSALEVNGLKVIVLQNMTQALFIIGTREEVRKAEEIIRNVETQIGGIRDKVVYWYTVKHSDPEELADILYRVYSLMMATNPDAQIFASGGSNGDMGRGPGVPIDGSFRGNGGEVNGEGGDGSFPPPPVPQKEPPLNPYQQEGFYQEGGYVVNPAPAQPRVFDAPNPNNNRENFIVDVKTGAIVMVIEGEILPKIKDLLRKLDVPKKMVQIETLLFEKVLNRENTMGLNLLKIGEAAMNHHKTGAFFNNLFPNEAKKPVTGNEGIFEFFMSRKATDSGIPAFDLVYRFLLNQDDVQINSSPSLLTVNQTPASIVINEDISINTGVFEVETNKGVTLKDAFTRAQYGITISIKPTIHLAQCNNDESEYDYVTMETDITFDTINPSRHADRPNVTRRHITNQVQVIDGDTVILGGLRRKISTDRRESIPFIGEVPGLGKLFSINASRDSNTEMFIFITPHIVKDPKEQLTCLRQELLALRPGDIPYFLECVQESSQYERTRLMEGSMTLLFGRPKDRYYLSGECSSCDRAAPEPSGEYDGR